MARKQREKASTGIYHVMLRGINKQDIFLEVNDFESMIKTLREVQYVRSDQGDIISRNNCTFYAYCILHNHLHLLVREGQISISEILKRIQDRFVFIYNHKYERVGHLFQDRFASEPVEDASYFYTLLRYIHRNPVKALEVCHPEDYPWSSWREYLATGQAATSLNISPNKPLQLPEGNRSEKWLIKGSDPFINHIEPICDTATIIKRFGFDELVKWVNTDADTDTARKPIDMDSFVLPMKEEEVWAHLSEVSQTTSVEEFKQLWVEKQVQYIRQLVDEGISLHQLARMSSMSYSTLWNRLHPEEYEAKQAERREVRKLKRQLQKGKRQNPEE